jgi:hypothetical protein
MNNKHDWTDAYEAIRRHLQNEEIDPTPHLFCLEHYCNDGCLLLLGKNQRPTHVGVMSTGPLESAALGKFVDRIVSGLIWTRGEGARGADDSWNLFGALPAAQSLPKAERDRLEESFAPITVEVKQWFHQMQMNN